MAEAAGTPPAQPGDVLAERYTVLAQIGRGGFGFVFKALDRRLDRPVAIKILTLPDDTDDALARELLDRFGHEAWVTARLKHPNIVAVHDRDLHGSAVFLVMDLLTGPSLAQLVKDRGPLDPAAAVGYGMQTIAALEYIHRLPTPVVHRDLKPANLVLDDGQPLKVCDFGIASVVAAELTRYTRPGHAAPGTLAFMCPEHWRGEPPTPAWDMYSFGAVLYTLLAGTTPFRAPKDPLRMWHLVENVRPVPIDALRPDVPRALAALLDALLAKPASARPDVAQTGDALTAIAASLGVVPPGSPAAPTSPLRHADHLLALGRYADAERAFAAIVAQRAGAGLPPDEATYRAQFGRVRAEYALNHGARAALRLARLADDAQAALGPAHPLVREIREFWSGKSS